jgi:glycolate oxidase FAD binding subunit
MVMVMSHLEPATPEELAELLRQCASTRESITLTGNGSKYAIAGPVVPSQHEISMKGLRRLLMYEPRDLTVSVEAGFGFSELQSLLKKNGQMIALDPPFAEQATIGGVVVSNTSGPLRRGYGTARDLVIGMKFATLEGSIVQSGGMVVKNVAGLDMGKMMIGSFGTLAAVTSVNFRLHSMPEGTATFLYTFPELEPAIQKRDALVASVLQPISIDLLSPAVAHRFSRRGFVLAIRAAGSEKVLRRYRRELSDAEPLTEDDGVRLWHDIQEYPSAFLNQQKEGVIIRVSTTLEGILSLPKTVTGAFISRAANGITFFYFPAWNAAASWWQKLSEQRSPAAIEYAPEAVRSEQMLWSPSRTEGEEQAFAMMKRVKQMFDPELLLNRNRLYGRI